ncbi:hypothetical protein CSOJ01_12642 [Colletotrichum sojae]|uniref:Uncharacterized protein n=1 Tax=Colletotrichum sojae TaxID=2175907 RepID=A0A8H6IUC0_9PEZI|nr:hypothetical protein CSOJ01_12642 [Colletotrichum sojae]
MSNYTHVNGTASGNGDIPMNLGYGNESQIPRSERGSSVISTDSDKSLEAADAATREVVNMCRDLIQLAPTHDFIRFENPALANAIDSVRQIAQTVVILAEANNDNNN